MDAQPLPLEKQTLHAHKLINVLFVFGRLPYTREAHASSRYSIRSVLSPVVLCDLVSRSNRTVPNVARE